MQETTPGHSKVFQLVGVGSLRGDDAIGLVVSQEIEKRLRESDQQVARHAYRENLRIDLATSPVRLLDLMPDADTLVIFDAWLTDNEPIGTTRKWVWPNVDIQNTRFTGSHDLSLGDALLLGERLGVLPRHVLIWGIAVAPEPAFSQCLHRLATVSSPAESQLAIDIHRDIPWQECLSKKLFDSVPSIIDCIMSKRFL